MGEVPQKGISLKVELEGSNPEGSYLKKVKFKKEESDLVSLVDSKSAKGKEEAPRDEEVCSELPASSSLLEEGPISFDASLFRSVLGLFHRCLHLLPAPSPSISDKEWPCSETTLHFQFLSGTLYSMNPRFSISSACPAFSIG